MNDDEIRAIFDQQAAGYDERWAKTAPIRVGLHFLLEAVFAELPTDARVLCVGSGTGEEIEYLAQRYPGWSFVAVEPSVAMQDLSRRRANSAGYASRCAFHAGYLDSLPAQAPFDAATCFLVSQFILDRSSRIAFFAGIASRLRAGGVLASSDLASDTSAPAYSALLTAWMNMMKRSGVPTANIEQMRAAYAKDVAVCSPTEIEGLIAAGGFENCTQFYQAGLIHAWFSRRQS